MITRQALAVAALLPFMAIPAAAQNSQYHYQGGPRAMPHIGELPMPTDDTAKVRAKQKEEDRGPHYQGGPKAIPHYGNLPEPEKRN